MRQGPLPVFFPPSLNGQLFAQGIANAYRQGVRLWDPSVALQRDADPYETMLRTGIIAQCCDRRTGLAAGLNWAVEPQGDTDLDKTAAKVDEAILRNIRQFRAARRHLATAIIRGTAFAYAEWTARWLPLGDGRYREWVVPRVIRGIDRRMFRGVPRAERLSNGAEVVKVEWERFGEANASWNRISEADKPNYIRHAHDDGPERTGHGRGLVDALYFLWYFRAAIIEEWMNGIEFWSRGFVEVAVKGLREGTKINQQIVDDYQEQVEAHRSRQSFVHDEQDVIKLTQGGGEGANICKSFVEAIDQEIRTLVNQSNDNVASGDSGSYARADVHSDSEQMLADGDRESLGETISLALIERARELNYANYVDLGFAATQPGRFAILNQKADDPEKTMGVFDKALRAGIPIGKRHVYERLGIPMPAAGEDVIAAIAQPAQASPFGGGFLGLPSPSVPDPKE